MTIPEADGHLSQVDWSLLNNVRHIIEMCFLVNCLYPDFDGKWKTICLVEKFKQTKQKQNSFFFTFGPLSSNILAEMQFTNWIVMVKLVKFQLMLTNLGFIASPWENGFAFCPGCLISWVIGFTRFD